MGQVQVQAERVAERVARGKQVRVRIGAPELVVAGAEQVVRQLVQLMAGQLRGRQLVVKVGCACAELC